MTGMHSGVVKLTLSIVATKELRWHCGGSLMLR